MKLSFISEATKPTIVYANDEDWEIADQADRIAKESGIRISSNKNLTFVAMIGDEVAGAVWTAFAPDRDYSDEQEVWRYDFDVAVSPKQRALGMTSAKIGPKLIETALDDYQSRKSDVPAAYIRVWVVNGKLAAYLENHYGFEPDGEWSLNNPHMTKH
jgi:ribosomal protein S18 acetylase RimI-like enzyme